MHQVVPLTDWRHAIDVTAARNLRIAAGLLGAVASVLEGAASVLEEDYGRRQEPDAFLVILPPEPLHAPRSLHYTAPIGPVRGTAATRRGFDGRRPGEASVHRHLVAVPPPGQASSRWPHPVRVPHRPPA